MSKKNLVLLTGVFTLAAVLTVFGQQQSQMQSPPSSQQPATQPLPQMTDGSLDAQTAVDASGKKRYLVGPGDVIDVRVFGQPDLSSTVEIDDEGNISSLPFLEEPIPAMCRNEKDIQKAIALAYSKYLRSPRVSVRVTERKSRPPAVVFGAVRAPTRIQMMRRVRLHELLVAAGGITLNASGKIQIVHTERDMCPQDYIMTPDIAEALANKSVTTSTYEKATNNAGSAKPVVTTVSDKTTAASDTTGSGKPGSAPVSDKTTAASDTTGSGKPGSVPASNKKAAASDTTVSSKPGSVPASNKTAAASSSNGPSPTVTSGNQALQKPAAADGTDKKDGAKFDQSLSDIGRIEIYDVGEVRTGLGKDDPFIRPGDIVIVTEGEPIYINGFVNAPREIVMKDNMTLVRAIAMAGGIQKTAKSHEIYIYRQVKGKIGPEKMKFDYDAIKNGKQTDVLLQAYDIIDVRPQSSFSPENLRQMILGITKGSIGGLGGVAGSLPYRILY
jgi:protein involved in polysaccharide export with SLBB domain